MLFKTPDIILPETLRLLERLQQDAVLEDFSQANGMGRTAWTPRVLTRVGPVSGLSGRDRMRAALAALGFSLR